MRRPVGLVLLVTLLALLALYAVALFYLRPPSPGAELTLDQLTRDALCSTPGGGTGPAPTNGFCSDSADIQRVNDAQFLDEDARIVGTTKARDSGGPVTFWTSYPKSDAATADLLRELIESGARVSVDSQTFKGVVHFVAQYLLPLAVLANLFALLLYLIQGAGRTSAAALLRFGRVGRRNEPAQSRRTTFNDIAAADEAIAELAEVRDYLATPDAFTEMGALPPKGVLLVGPPGCGKTLMARAVAGEAAASFFAMSGSEFVEVLVGVGAARVRDLFQQARAMAPSIIFIDEIDAVGRQRGAGFGQGHDEREQTLNELLAQMDGFSASEGIVVIGATNRPDILDPALLRAGRFDRHVTLDRPDLDGRRQILTLHAKGRKLENSERDLPRIARATAGFTGADLANLLNEAALLAVRERAAAIGTEHLDEAVERVVAGPKRRGRIVPEDEKCCIAYHEAGHAIVAAALGKSDGLSKLSIISRGRGVGHLALLHEERSVLRRADMEAQIAVAMAGIAAEEFVFGEPSTGAEQDLQRATTMARDMAGRYGMSRRLGKVRVLHEDREVFLGRDYLATRDVSQPTLEHLDDEVSSILREQEDIARSMLARHRALLDKCAAALVQDETLDGSALQRLLSEVNAAARVDDTNAVVIKSEAADGHRQ